MSLSLSISAYHLPLQIKLFDLEGLTFTVFTTRMGLSDRIAIRIRIQILVFVGISTKNFLCLGCMNDYVVSADSTNGFPPWIM